MSRNEDIDVEKERRDTKIGFGCMGLFLSPFLLVGGWALISSLSELASGAEFTEDIGGRLGVGATFTLVAGSVFALMLYGYRKSNEETTLKQQYPNEPWKWQQDWLEGRLQSSSIAAMLVTGFFGVTFGAAGVLVLFKLGEITEDEPLGYFVLLFPLVGFGMLGTSVYYALQWLKYRKVHLDLVTNPGVIGGWFQAILWADINFGPSDTLDAQLTCY